MTDNSLNVLSRPAKGGGGDKPPVVFVHGAWHGAWCWQARFLDYFTEHGFDVHAPDLRGHGDSPPIKAMRWNRIADYVDDVASVVEKFDRKPVLVGHSMGGFISQHCMRRSDNLAAVGLLATVPHYGAVPVTAKIAMRRPIDFAKVNLMWTLYPLVRDPAKACHMFIEDDVKGEEALAFAARLIDESYFGYLDMLLFDLPGRYSGDLPVMVIGGEKDTLFSIASQKATARRYNAQCHIVPGAPHNLMMSSQWQETADRLITWIDTL